MQKPRAIFFDAAGTLLHLRGTVGHHYALAARTIGLELNPDELDRAFAATWSSIPAREAIEGPRDDDDKPWWREFVDRMLADAVPRMHELDRDNFFEVAYEHFAEPGVWQLYPEAVEVLVHLHGHFELSVVSNFDGRLRLILEHLGISKFFGHVFLSSEIGADKPDPQIFVRALGYLNLRPEEVCHVGDDAERDWKAASEAGLQIFKLERPKNSLRDLLMELSGR